MAGNFLSVEWKFFYTFERKGKSNKLHVVFNSADYVRLESMKCTIKIRRNW